MSKDTSGPAFPFTEHNHDQTIYSEYPGMTLRQYYAAMAMQGMIASGALTVTGDWHIRPFNEQEVSDRAFAMADAMIAEGNK